MKVLRWMFASMLACNLGVSTAVCQQRPPAIPLITHDPYFSVWSATDKLTDSDTVHWTGTPQPITGIARIDGKPYRFMGRLPGRRLDPVAAMEQTEREITLTHTSYAFKQGGVTLKFVFFTPAMMNNIDLLSRPVTYLSWSVQATDGAPHDVSIMLDVDPVIAVNERGQQVVMSRSQTSGLNVLSAGSKEQNVLNRSGDNLRVDWGYFRLAVPKNENATTAITPNAAAEYATTGKLPVDDSIGMPQSADRSCPHLAVVFDLGHVGAQGGESSSDGGLYGRVCDSVSATRSAALLATQQHGCGGVAEQV